MKYYLLTFGLIIFLVIGCTNQSAKNKLIIFHAGSLAVPFKQIADSFMIKYPETVIELEAAGSLACARKIIDLNKPCDIMASADYLVIDNLLIPNYATWNLKFALNEMVIVYTDKSKFADEITPQNWPEILLHHEVNYGRSDPDSDPCGYRTILVTKLAERQLFRQGLSDSILKKDNEHIRPKEVDLLALLETQVIDYVFIYRSVATQHQLNYILLNDSINLRNPNFDNLYSKVYVEISGKQPGEKITLLGEPIIYGLTQITNAPNPELAQQFLNFFFTDSVGLKIMEQNGQPMAAPNHTTTFAYLPEYLKAFALPDTVKTKFN